MTFVSKGIRNGGSSKWLAGWGMRHSSAREQKLLQLRCRSCGSFVDVVPPQA